MGAALGAGDGVHLVDDHRLDAAQRLARLRGEHQEQRLGRGDQDVGRGRLDPAPVLRRGVTRAHADPDLGHLDAEPFGGLADADQRGAQVALDVDGERLEGRDVEDPAALLLLRHRLGGQPVDRPQERRQRLAGAGRRHHQGVPSRRDRVPRAALRGRRLREGSGEPLLRRRAELVHPVHPARRHRQLSRAARPGRHDVIRRLSGRPERMTSRGRHTSRLPDDQTV